MNLLQTFEQEQITKLAENKTIPDFQAGRFFAPPRAKRIFKAICLSFPPLRLTAGH